MPRKTTRICGTEGGTTTEGIPLYLTCCFGGGTPCGIRVCGPVQIPAEADRPDESGDSQEHAGGGHAAVFHPVGRGGERKTVCRLDAALRPYQRQSGGGLHCADSHGEGWTACMWPFCKSKIAEMKETAGNRDVAQRRHGLRHYRRHGHRLCRRAGGKLSRNMIDDGYEAFSDVVTLCIELIRQFWFPGSSGCAGGHGTGGSSSRQPGPAAPGDGRWDGGQLPGAEFDLEVSAQDENPYDHGVQSAGSCFRWASGRIWRIRALHCLELMDFKNKDRLMSSILRGQTAMAPPEERPPRGRQNQAGHGADVSRPMSR